jgi:hypothetical protein
MNIFPDGKPACSLPGVSGTLTYYTTDGTYLRLDLQGNQDGDLTNDPWTLFMPDGTRVLGGPIPGSTALQRIIDRNGNYIEVLDVLEDSNYNNHHTVSIKDQLGRAIVLEYGYAPNQDAIHVRGTGGQEMLWIVKWKSILVRKNYHASQIDINRLLSTTFRVVEQVNLPTQAGNLYYAFDYNANAINDPSYGWTRSA